ARVPLGARPAPRSPYTTLFRSDRRAEARLAAERHRDELQGGADLGARFRQDPAVPDCGHPGARILDHAEALGGLDRRLELERRQIRKSTRLNSSHVKISYAVFC